ncbi:Leucine-rich repeat typical subtype [Penicillium expansum]|nr:Leucine-rich repeat typical subtype [Penicillium expansum]
MEKINTGDGQLFIKNVASYVRTHEKALANALQLRRQPTKNAIPQSPSVPLTPGSSFASTSSTLAAAFSSAALKFMSQNAKTAKLTLTPHHLFYLLSRFEELTIAVGPMNIRLENIQTEVSQSYVSFLNKPQQSGAIGPPSIQCPVAKAALETDLKYLYSAFTKIPCLRLAPDHRAPLISGYEEFPFDTAVPLHSFKNLSALEIIDLDYRSFYGWDRLSEQLRTLTIKRAHLDDPADLLTRIVLDDIDKRRRRSAKSQHSPSLGWSGSQPVHTPDQANSISAPGSPIVDTAFGTSTSPRSAPMFRTGSEGARIRARAGSVSPTRPGTKHGHRRGQSRQIRRTGSASSESSETSTTHRSGSSTNLLADVLSPSKWRFLRHLGLPENSLTSVSAASLAPVANSLNSLDLSSNLLTEIPEGVASLVALRALNLSHCMIESLHSLTRNPLPAITVLTLRGNRLRSLAGIERLLSLERLDLRDNNLTDPTEIARLTSLPEIREIWVSGNPFVKTHSGYRVVIMNLFRRTPGYSEDIIIDGRGPGYTERKQLVERVAEPQAAPVVRSSPADASTVVQKSTISKVPHDLAIFKPEEDEGDLHINGTQLKESDGGTNRRKKLQRRRIVDISVDNPFNTDGLGNAGSTVLPALPVQQVQPPVDHPIVVPVDQPWRLDSAAHSGSSSIQSPEKSVHSSPPLVQALQGKDRTMDEEFCRQQLEVLRQGVGHNWLTVLGENDWNNSHKDFAHSSGVGLDHSPHLSTPPITRSNTQAILSGHALSG